jgi:iron complex transport system substrate-binding protein
MHKKIKFSSLMVVALLLALVLMGCGGKSKNAETDTGNQAAAEEKIAGQENAPPETSTENTENTENATPENIADEAKPTAAAAAAASQTSLTQPAQSAKPAQAAAATIQSPAPQPAQQQTKFRLVESDGTVFERDRSPQRIVVLSVPTAIIMDTLGIELAGITMTGRALPPNLAKLPEVGMPRDPNIEVIKSLNADLVIISKDFKDMNKAKMEQHNIPVYFIANQLYEDTYKSIEILGKAFGKEEKANQLIRDMRAREAKALNAAQGKPAPKVLILFGTVESFTMQRSNTFTGNLVKLLGGKNIADDMKLNEQTAGNLPLSIEQIVAFNPDIIFRISHGTAEETQKIYEQEFTRNPIWNAVAAQQNNRVYDLPMQLFFANSGLQVIDAIEHLAKLMYP